MLALSSAFIRAQEDLGGVEDSRERLHWRAGSRTQSTQQRSKELTECRCGWITKEQGEKQSKAREGSKSQITEGLWD